jgi:hypothetical protein
MGIQKDKTTKNLTKFLLLVLCTSLFAFTGCVNTAEYGSNDFADAANNSKHLPFFQDSFNQKGTLQEAGSFKESDSIVWWLNSGGILNFKNGLAETIQGDLPPTAKWHKRFQKANPDETDNGYHPQNIFRLVTQSSWKNLQQETWFRITNYHCSKSSHRAASNGILFFNRYIDGDNLYYTGVRVDGKAIIKKKTNGKYFTMADESVFPGKKYDRDSNPNLLPLKSWIGLRSVVINESDKTVRIKLFMNYGNSNRWRQVAEAVDDGRSYGGPAILEAGHAGIRTDFMDVQFDNYKIAEINKNR